MALVDDGRNTWPRLHLSVAELVELSKLPEYSATNPTGVTPGKRWRRQNGVFDEQFIKAGGQPYWLIGRYDLVEHDSTRCYIRFFRPCVRVKAGRKEEWPPVRSTDRVSMLYS